LDLFWKCFFSYIVLFYRKRPQAPVKRRTTPYRSIHLLTRPMWIRCRIHNASFSS